MRASVDVVTGHSGQRSQSADEIVRGTISAARDTSNAGDKTKAWKWGSSSRSPKRMFDKMKTMSWGKPDVSLKNT